MEKINLVVKKRKDIRKRVVELLKGKTAAKDAVFPNASVPPWHEELPVILVYPRNENASEYAIAPRELKREVQIGIEIIATGPETDEEGQSPPEGESLEDILDNLAEEIERILAADETFGGLADDSILTGTDFTFDSEGGAPVGSCRLTYNVTYYRPSPDLEPGHDVFSKADAKWKVGHDNAAPDAIIEANDSVDIPQS